MLGFLRRLIARRVPSFDLYQSRLRNRRGLEIGGPSAVFEAKGEVPLYPLVGSLDGAVYSHSTIWREGITEGLTYPYGGRLGRQLVCEATELTPVADGEYEFLCASHVLEHIANPLRALQEWKRVTGASGVFCLVFPHKEGTFDHRRPVTALEHLQADFDNQIGEDDQTHLQEWLSLIDLSRAPAEKSVEAFRARAEKNLENRGMHHHVFDSTAAVRLVDRAGLQVLAVDAALPFHIFILAEKRTSADNSAFLSPAASYRQRSPFQSDRI